jgi:4-hydroxy-4-methyl-2-oxoglutarate aldolase
MSIAVRNIERPTAEQLKALGQFGVATIHEAQDRTGLLAPYMRPIFPGAKAVGSALTVLAHPGDNLMMHVAAELCQTGDIVVVALSSANTDAMLGDLLATSFRAHGGVGVIIDAGCRDVSELTAMKFPVWSKAISAKGAVKATAGSVNVQVVCAGTIVNPGDAVVADDDGIVIVPRAEIERVTTAAREREERETKVRARLTAGEVGLDIYNMRPKLEQLGIKYVDAAKPQSKEFA